MYITAGSAGWVASIAAAGRGTTHQEFTTPRTFRISGNSQYNKMIFSVVLFSLLYNIFIDAIKFNSRNS
jgi:hypothetical protein